MSGLAQLLTKARQVATVRPQRSASSKRQGSGSAPRLARWKTARRAQKAYINLLFLQAVILSRFSM